jgi:hypothetical protein
MRLVDLSMLYLVVGGACAVALYRRGRERGREAFLHALLAIPLWPLWGPIAWSGRREPPVLGTRASDRIEPIRAALDEGVQAVAGTPLERLLNRESAGRILDEVLRVAGRHEELVLLLSRPEFDRESAERRLEALERQAAPGSTGRMRGSARLHLENVRRLCHFAERDAGALEELSELILALRTQLLLVRLSGSSTEGVGDIVNELWAPLEGLSEAERAEAVPEDLCVEPLV